MQEESKYIEEWTVIINRHSYELTPQQSDVVKKAIADGQKGMILFDTFAINLAMIQEFFLSNKKLNPKYILPRGNDVVIDKDSQEYKKSSEKLHEIRQRLQEKLSH